MNIIKVLMKEKEKGAIGVTTTGEVITASKLNDILFKEFKKAVSEKRCDSNPDSMNLFYEKQQEDMCLLPIGELIAFIKNEMEDNINVESQGGSGTTERDTGDSAEPDKE